MKFHVSVTISLSTSGLRPLQPGASTEWISTSFYFHVLEASLGRVLLEYMVLVFYSATFFSGLVNILAKNFNSGVLL